MTQEAVTTAPATGAPPPELSRRDDPERDGSVSAKLDPIEVPTLDVRPNGAMAGRTIRMRYPSVRLWIASERGQLDNTLMWEEILGAIESHDLGRDPASLRPTMITDIGEAWMEAVRQEAIPPTTGND